MIVQWPTYQVTCKDAKGVILQSRPVHAPDELHAIKWVRMAYPEVTARGVTCETRRARKWA